MNASRTSTKAHTKWDLLEALRRRDYEPTGDVYSDGGEGFEQFFDFATVRAIVDDAGGVHVVALDHVKAIAWESTVSSGAPAFAVEAALDAAADWGDAYGTEVPDPVHHGDVFARIAASQAAEGIE